MYFFEIVQKEIVVASGMCPSMLDCTQMVAHYLSEYEKEGPIDEVIIRRKTEEAQ